MQALETTTGGLGLPNKAAMRRAGVSRSRWSPLVVERTRMVCGSEGSISQRLNASRADATARSTNERGVLNSEAQNGSTLGKRWSYKQSALRPARMACRLAAEVSPNGEVILCATQYIYIRANLRLPSAKSVSPRRLVQWKSEMSKTDSVSTTSQVMVSPACGHARTSSGLSAPI